MLSYMRRRRPKSRRQSIPPRLETKKLCPSFDLAMRSQRLSRPDPIAQRQAQGFSKVCDRVRPKILEAQQRFVGCFADLADSIQARVRKHIMNARRKSNAL